MAGSENSIKQTSGEQETDPRVVSASSSANAALSLQNGTPEHNTFQLGSGPPPTASIEPLKITIVGAGIAGLTAALSLRQAGHNVVIFEQSRFKEELGAALHICSNAARCLLKLGIKPEGLRGVDCRGSTVYRGNGTLVRQHWNKDVEKKYGAPWWLAHRVDLHNELRKAALGEEGQGPPAVLHLQSPVREVDAETGTIVLQNGQRHQADLVIGADGVHSIVREVVFGSDKAVTTASRAFRFVLEAADIDDDDECIDPVPGACTAFIEPEQRFVLYPCRQNKIYNCVLIVQDGVAGSTPQEGWNTVSSVEEVLELYRTPKFSQKLINTIRKAKTVRCWQLLKRKPIDCWVKGRVCVIGDAAHPMLPYQGQGGGQAIEDGAALGMFFTTGTRPEHVGQLLAMFNQARYRRASLIAAISASEESDRPMADMKDVEPFIMSHDAMEFAKQMRTTDLVA